MIYLDNSATTYPKPLSVINASNYALKNFSFNSGRGGYRQSVNTASKIYDVRQKAGSLLGCEEQNIIFTQNCTFALNMAIKGILRKGDNVLISNLEHNAVARPIQSLADKGSISYDVFSYSYDDDELIKNITKLIKHNTRLIVCTHASNVFGCVFPIEKIAKLASEKGLYFIVDGAQGAGIFDVDCKKSGISAYCVAGHKGLYGTMSTGMLALNSNVNMDTIIEGGTGSSSMNLSQPEFLPDRFESGSLNNSGIIALGAGIDFVNNKGINNIYNHELMLISHLYDELNKIQDIVLYTPRPQKNKMAPLLSLNYKDYSSEELAGLLAKNNIAVRAGLHCSPLAHKSYKTLKRGTVRISVSIFTTRYECEKFLNTLKKL